MPDLIDFDHNRITYIVPDKFKSRITDQVSNVTLMTGLEIIQTDNRIALRPEQGVNQMGTDESGSTRDQMSHGVWA
jgi:hypothetical protein